QIPAAHLGALDVALTAARTSLITAAEHIDAEPQQARTGRIWQPGCEAWSQKSSVLMSVHVCTEASRRFGVHPN
ncbi:hypothetical protein, partial [Cryobacterium sp. MDB1-18-2]|uniref:hypothetical protein n=1 Tax=Cryobacterium sp. MDB1-18-2 TaxID=1259169 RepID=UPI001A7E8A82